MYPQGVDQFVRQSPRRGRPVAGVEPGPRLAQDVLPSEPVVEGPVGGLVEDPAEEGPAGAPREVRVLGRADEDLDHDLLARGPGARRVQDLGEILGGEQVGDEPVALGQAQPHLRTGRLVRDAHGGQVDEPGLRLDQAGHAGAIILGLRSLTTNR
ncbi:hypothetical protein Misp01_63790 [Microtetraspora sp. NBRC 13810]|nr:hypothetical protein Misp01_63790 [Microtetraspora sp. NBRC 13810]